MKSTVKILTAIVGIAFTLQLTGCSWFGSGGGSGDSPPTQDGLTLSGTVTFSDDTPLNEVALRVVASETCHPTAFSNASGFFLFGGLEEDTYTITLSKLGFTFFPESMEIPVTSSESNLNFIAAKSGNGKFSIYSDANHPDNHYTASGWMGDTDLIEFDEGFTENVYEGMTCQKWSYLDGERTKGWAGVVWQSPPGNGDGNDCDGGYYLRSAVSLEFWARGAKGGEVIDFGFAGLEGPYGDSAPERIQTFVLSTEWRRFSIAVDDLDLTSIHNGFMWRVEAEGNEAITFFLDDIHFEYILDGDSSQSVNHKLPGISFGPFTQGNDPTTGYVATVDQVEEHMAILAPYTNWIRTYGTAGGLAEAGRIAHEKGLKIAMGAWLDRDDSSNVQELTSLVNAAKAGEVDIAVIGNEVLLRRDMSLNALVSFIQDFKTVFPDIPVTTAELWENWINHPELVNVCDVIFTHHYSFWDGIALEQAVAALHAQYQQVLNVASGKKIYVAETGWPSDGVPRVNAVPSVENASFYFLNVASWARALDVDYFYFEAFDEPFKINQEPNGVGASWGIFGTDLKLKNGMIDVFNGMTINDNWTSGIPCGDGDPSIEFTSVPPVGSQDNLRGIACHVSPFTHAVAVYIRVFGGWWTKPFLDRKLTKIQFDGTFVTDITTGGSDTRADRIAAFLVPATYDPPSASGGSLPNSIENVALASLIVVR